MAVAQEIDDPEDEKPDDWVDEEEIDDPEATKPEDWDDDAPATIPDMDAAKPEVHRTRCTRWMRLPGVFPHTVCTS